MPAPGAHESWQGRGAPAASRTAGSREWSCPAIPGRSARMKAARERRGASSRQGRGNRPRQGGPARGRPKSGGGERPRP